MDQFLYGVAFTLCAIIGLIFLRFWIKASDRLFLYFAVSFWLLGGNWIALAIVRESEPHTLLYFVRLMAFALLLAGIWDKNRVRGQASTPSPARGAGPE
jgi:uncharacterized protein DUF5985